MEGRIQKAEARRVITSVLPRPYGRGDPVVRYT